jgi:hypothetical protein
VEAIGIRRIRSAAAICVIAGFLTTSGCTDNAESAHHSPDQTTATATTCYSEARIPDEDLAAVADNLKLPPGVQVVTGTLDTSNRSPDRLVVSLHLCVPDVTGSEALRPIATDVAHALKRTSLGGRTAVLYVSDMNPKSVGEEGKLRDGDFQAHPWDGTLPREAELRTWEAVVG